MGLMRNVVMGATMMTLVAGTAQSQSINVTGNTKGCFGSTSCTPTDPSSGGFLSGLAFDGVNSFNWAAVSGTPQTVNLGALTVNGTYFGFGGYDDTPFKLFTTITSPPTSPNSGSYVADLDGSFFFNPNGVAVDFNNTAKEFDFAGGSIYLSVNDMQYNSAGTQNVTGTLTYQASTTPEPSSMALIGTGLVGLVPVFRRKRRA